MTMMVAIRLTKKLSAQPKKNNLFFLPKLSYAGKMFSFGGINHNIWKKSYVEECNLLITNEYEYFQSHISSIPLRVYSAPCCV
jgi:hypothetical protein